MSIENDLGNLVLSLNPYTGQAGLPGGKQTGSMDIYLNAVAPGVSPSYRQMSQVRVEVDDNYPADWSFKGEPQKVNRAVRIQYRYPVNDSSGNPLYWVEDYLLLGFEGSGGGN